MDLQEDRVLDSQQSNNENVHNVCRDSPPPDNFTASFGHHVQAQFLNPEQFLCSNQFNPSQFQFHPNYGLNRVTAPYPPTAHQLYASGLPFQGILNAPIPYVDTQASNISKRSKKKENVSNNSKKSQSNQSGNSYRHWTIEEDVALTKAYLYISIDSIVGKDQSCPKLWDRVLKVWREHMGTYDEKRGRNSLTCRWNTIQMAVGKFHSLYESLERAPKSGTTITDMKKEALNMYRELGDGTPFKFEHCWEIMKNNPKWCSAQLTKTSSSKKVKIVNDIMLNNPPPATPTAPTDHIDVDNPSNEKIIDGDDGLVRPLGRKGSKEKRKKMNEQMAVIDVLNSFQCTLEKQCAFNQQNLELRQKMLKKDLELKEKAQQLKEEAQRRKQKAEKRKEQERIMNTDLNNLQPALRLAYEKMQIQIMKEWEEEGLFGHVSRNSNDDVEM